MRRCRPPLGAHHAATRPDAVGFLYLDGHVRVYTGTRQLPKTHIARMRIAGPATEETWVTDTDGDPVMVITAPPSASLAAELARLLPDLRVMIGADRPCTVVFDRTSGRVRARARFRDFDGRCRAVTRWGASREEAADRLEIALAERAAFPARDWAGGATVAAAVSLWQADLDAGALAPGTRQLYRAASRLYVQPALGGVRLGEVTPAVIDRALAAVRMCHGPQPARAARRALSSLCADAVRHGAIGHNPVIDSRPIACPHRPVRALSAGEAIDLQVRLRGAAAGAAASSRPACLTIWYVPCGYFRRTGRTSRRRWGRRAGSNRRFESRLAPPPNI